MEKLKQVVPTVVWDYTPVAVFTFGGLWVIKKVGFKIINYVSKQRMLSKFKHTPKDVVVLHMVPRGRTCPSPSSFVLKLETYLRMLDIPYQVDTEYPFGPTLKTPWITINGQHIGDSELIIEFLSKKFDKRMVTSYTPEERALGRMARVLVEDHIYWGGFLWRYYYRGGQDLEKIFSLGPLATKIVRRKLFALAKTATFYQGLGRHSKENVIKIISDSLRALSLFIGEKKFLLGDEPCEEDCALFGFLAQMVWSFPDPTSPYQRLLNEELQNLITYSTTMREIYWPDWDKFLVK